MKRLFVIFCLFLITIVNIDGMVCNGYKEFCGRRYNEIAQVNSHNATSNTTSVVQDQDRTISQQLADGIRVFKVPIHYDYANRIGFYDDMIRAHMKELDQEIDKLTAEANKRKNEAIAVLNSKQKDVDSIQREINSTQKTIDDKNKWFKSLPKFSLTKDSQTLRGIDYAAQIAGLQTKLVSLKAAKETATQVLNASKQVGGFFIEQDPRILAVKIRKGLLEPALKLTGKYKDRTIYACHALPKNELYKNYIDQKFIDDLIDKSPSELKPITKAIFQPLEGSTTKIIKFLYGESKDAGGVFPYPACLLDLSAVPLKDFLTQIRQFVDTHPSEVITILLNDFAKNNADIAKIFNESGLLRYVYAHNQNEPWPTFRELIESGKRIIVFTDSGDAPGYPWLNNRSFYDAWQGKFGFTSTDKFTNPNTPLSEFGDYSYVDKPPYNKIHDVSYAVTPGLSGTKKDASIVNQRTVMRNHMKRLAEAAKQIPNWISVDFYEYPNNDVFDVVNEINGVGKYSGKPLWSPSTAK